MVFGRRARAKAAKQAEQEALEEQRQKALERLRPYAADIAQGARPERTTDEGPRPPDAREGTSS